MIKSGKKTTIGLILIFFSLICFSIGGYIWYMNTQWTDRNGYTISQKIKLNTDSPLIVFSDHSFNLKEEISPILQRVIKPDDFISERWTIKNNLEKNVFIGIATADKARDYCKLMHYKEADDWDVSTGPWEMKIWVNSYLNHPGADSTQPPGNVNIWLTSGSGKATAGFEKVMVSGDYWVMIMNADGSSGLDVDLDWGQDTSTPRASKHSCWNGSRLRCLWFNLVYSCMETRVNILGLSHVRALNMKLKTSCLSTPAYTVLFRCAFDQIFG